LQDAPAPALLLAKTKLALGLIPLGWLGLPLLLALPPAARAVLAHEFGHLSSNTSRFNARVYRQRARWETRRAALAHHGGLVVAGARRFLDWYAPYYAAYNWNLAMYTETLRPAADPLPLYRNYQARAPGDPDADFVTDPGVTRDATRQAAGSRRRVARLDRPQGGARVPRDPRLSSGKSC
jgi:hypothetical protein